MKSSVIVAGAGIGGLAAALGLLRAGQQVRVFEQVETLGDVGVPVKVIENFTSTREIDAALRESYDI